MSDVGQPFRRTRHCRSCGYQLDGLPAHRCPECGRQFDPERPATFRWGLAPDARRFLRASVFVPCAYVLLLFLLVYGAWGAAYLALGRIPQPYFDHPYYYSGPILLLSAFAQCCVFLGVPVAIFVGFLWYATIFEHQWFKRRWQRALLAVFGDLALVVAMWLLLDIAGALRWILSV